LRQVNHIVPDIFSGVVQVLLLWHPIPKSVAMVATSDSETAVAAAAAATAVAAAAQDAGQSFQIWSRLTKRVLAMPSRHRAKYQVSR
jgi:hypothetical protein